mgnify:CR=1 FL=1
MFNYNEYLQLCADAQIIPCDIVAAQFYITLCEPSHIPYISESGSVWAHKIGNKTRRSDRPLTFHVQSSLE